MAKSTQIYSDPKIAEQARNMTKAIFQTESGGDFNAKGGSGENGAGQWMPDTWKAHAKDVLGNENAPMTPENQSVVAQGTMRKLIAQGKNAAQIAAIWNSGSDENWEKKVGVNKWGVKYNVPAYVKSVTDAYQKVKAGSMVGKDPNNPSAANEREVIPTEDEVNAEEHGAFMPAKVGQDSALGAAGKTLANLPKSAINFAIGGIKMLNPLSIAKNIGDTVGMLKEESERTGESALSIFGKSFKETPKSAYQVLVPEAGKGVVEGVGGLIKGDMNQAGAGFEKAQRNIVNDPVGSVAPFVIAAQGGANLLKKTGIAPGAPAALDSAISRTAQTITKPVGAVFNKVGEYAGKTAKFAAGQATGLQPTTLTEVMKNPEAFTKANKATLDRPSLGAEIKKNLDTKKAALEETGEAYAPVRESGKMIKVEPNFLEQTIKDLTGLELKKEPQTMQVGKNVFGGKAMQILDAEGKPAFKGGGKFESSATSKIREAKDVRALQTFYDRYQPLFEKGEMTANEFLNMRSDLAKLSKFEREIGKSQPVEAVAQITRGKINSAYRSQLKGLAELDESFATQKAQFDSLKKGFLDKQGNLSESAYNKVANATGKGKDLLLDRLEQILPGITHKIKILKAIEDIEAASGIKVGTYSRGIITGGIGITAGIVPAIIQAILTSPEVAVPLLRQYGLLKNSRVVGSIMKILQKSGNIVNELPNNPAAQIGASAQVPTAVK